MAALPLDFDLWQHQSELKEHKPLIQAQVETAGFKLTDLSDWEPLDACKHMAENFKHKGQVFLVNCATLRRRKSSDKTKLMRIPNCFGHLVLPNRNIHNLLSAFVTKATIAQWLSADVTDCIVCFESVGRKSPQCFVCGAVTCVKCSFDLMAVNDQSNDDLHNRCPNCRHYIAGVSCVDALFISIYKPSLPFYGVKLDNAQKHMVCKWTGYGGFGDTSRFKQAHSTIAVLKQAFADLNRGQLAKMCEGLSGKELESAKKRLILNALKETIFAQARHYAAALSRNNCANCGKGFWDKKAKRKAPKCAKCKRVAYCNARCRKKHRKIHAALHCGRSEAMPKKTVGFSHCVETDAFD